MAGNVSAEPEARPRMSFGLNFFLHEGALLKLLSSSCKSRRQVPIKSRSSTQPGLCSSGGLACLVTLHCDSTVACQVKCCGDTPLATARELRPVLGCGPSHRLTCHIETTSQTGTQTARSVSSEVASVLLVKLEYFSRTNDNNPYM